MAGKITKERLKSVLDESLLSVTLKVNGLPATVSPKIFFNLGENALKVNGYIASVEGTDEEIKDFAALIKFLATDKEKYDLIDINGVYNTVEELDEKHAFDNISMADLLKKYSSADVFEMVVHCSSGEMTATQAKKACDELAEVMRKGCLEQFNYISEEERAKLPDFYTLYAQISEECKVFRAERADYIEKHDGNAFFCDEFARKKTKYAAPLQLWHLYSAVDHVEACAWQYGRHSEEEADVEDILENFPVLRDALLNTEIMYSWHCTTSGSPAKVFRFKLNEETKAWLLTYEDDYDIARDGFEDLALYEGDKILFSSCTHEQFHTDCEK